MAKHNLPSLYKGILSIKKGEIIPMKGIFTGLTKMRTDILNNMGETREPGKR